VLVDAECLYIGSSVVESEAVIFTGENSAGFGTHSDFLAQHLKPAFWMGISRYSFIPRIYKGSVSLI
jgi:hypothetical protein